MRHLHDFAREVKLTEEEFQAAVGYIVALGKHTNETHNEAVLMSGSLGFSTLICLLNNGNNGQTETDANLLGPFWRMHSPLTESGGSIVRSPTPGARDVRRCLVPRHRGQPIEGAEVDIWHSSTEGFYENQDPVQADMNLRGKFITDQRRPFRLPQREAGRLSDPDRRADRRVAARAGPPQHAAGAPAFPGVTRTGSRR